MGLPDEAIIHKKISEMSDWSKLHENKKKNYDKVIKVRLTGRIK